MFGPTLRQLYHRQLFPTSSLFERYCWLNEVVQRGCTEYSLSCTAICIECGLHNIDNKKKTFFFENAKNIKILNFGWWGYSTTEIHVGCSLLKTILIMYKNTKLQNIPF